MQFSSWFHSKDNLIEIKFNGKVIALIDIPEDIAEHYHYNVNAHCFDIDVDHHTYCDLIATVVLHNVLVQMFKSAANQINYTS